jgi:hypothetical protein
VVSPSRRVVYLPDAIYEPRTPQQPSGKKGARSGDASARRHGGQKGHKGKARAGDELAGVLGPEFMALLQ